MQFRSAVVSLFGFTAYAAAGIFSAFPPLVLMPTLTEILIPEDFAKTTLVWSALALLTSMVGFGAVNSASVRYFKLSRQEFTNHLVSIILLIPISAVILLVGGGFINFQVYSFLPVMKAEFVIIILIASLMAFGQLFGSLAVATSRPYSYLKYYLLYGVITVLMVNIFIIILKLQIIGFLLGVLLGAVALALKAFFENSNLVYGGSASIRHSKSAVSFGLPIMFHTVALNLSSLSDRFIIAKSVGLSQLALYSATAQIALLANFAAHAIIKALQPRLYRLLRSPNVTTVKSIIRLARFYITVTLFLSISVGLFTPTIVELIAGSAYRIDRNTTVLLVVGGLFGSWYLFISLFIHFYERTFYILTITTISAIMQIFLCNLLVSNYGIHGASIAYATTNFIMFILTLIVAIVATRKHMETCG